MPGSADVVVIGGGIIGISTGYYLATKGWKNVVVLEKGLIGEGSTAKCAGGIRQQFSVEVTVRMAMASVRIYERFSEEFGVDAEFHQNGYVFLASTQDEMNLVRRNVEMQRGLGLDVRLLDTGDVRTMLPHVNVEDVIGGSYCPTDGYAGPYEVLQALAKAARRLGVKIVENAEVVGIQVEGGRVTGVETRDGIIHTELAVNAAGAWASQVGRMVDLDIPVLPYRGEIFVSEPFDELKDPLLMTVDLHTGWHFRKEGLGILMPGNMDVESSLNTDLHWTSLENAAGLAMHRVPCLERARFRTGWAGLLEDTPDQSPIIGRVPELDGFVCACGLSGHGFMLGPITGKVVSEIISGEPTSVDVSSLSLSRFKDGNLIAEKMFVHR